jgi:hypothetical protein
MRQSPTHDFSANVEAPLRHVALQPRMSAIGSKADMARTCEYVRLAHLNFLEFAQVLSKTGSAEAGPVASRQARARDGGGGRAHSRAGAIRDTG